MFEKINSLLFDNIGNKIKVVAKVFAWIQIIAGFIAGIILLFIGLDTLPGGGIFILIAPVVAIAGCFLAWLDASPIYGLGVAIENTERIKRVLSTSSTPTATTPPQTNSLEIVQSPDKCEDCATEKKETLAITTPLKVAPLRNQLTYAIAFTPDEGMVNQLKRINDERVSKILQSPVNTVREQIVALLKELE